jgi:S-adenosylmethionine synthetase
MAKECLVQVAYAIGVAEPVSVYVNTYGTGKLPDTQIAKIIMDEVDLTPRGIIKRLQLRRPIYHLTAAYGHFGRKEKEFTWEQTDLVSVLKKYL